MNAARAKKSAKNLQNESARQFSNRTRQISETGEKFVRCLLFSQVKSSEKTCGSVLNMSVGPGWLDRRSGGPPGYAHALITVSRMHGCLALRRKL
jgi:hypothetical protein